MQQGQAIFNSIKVRLKLSTNGCFFVSTKFQFHKGTIKTRERRDRVERITRFQFHKGTIKTVVRGFQDWEKFHFNSIKVRLKPLICLMVLAVTALFQFHKGTIKTGTHTSLIASSAYFNSIKVRLKPYASLSKVIVPFDFNSIKVRLKQQPDCCAECPLVFQFHKGTIKTKTTDTGLCKVTKFQFHKGTIKTLSYSWFYKLLHISIP